MNEHVEKSNLECSNCGSDYVIRLQWLDTYPEGQHWYDNHICLDCGRIVNQAAHVCLETLEKYRKEHGHLVFEK